MSIGTDYFKKIRILDGGMGQELLARGMEPLKGTSEHVGDLIDSCETVIELIESISETIQ